MDERREREPEVGKVRKGYENKSRSGEDTRGEKRETRRHGGQKKGLIGV